jgi:rubrerythrin
MADPPEIKKTDGMSVAFLVWSGRPVDLISNRFSAPARFCQHRQSQFTDYLSLHQGGSMDFNSFEDILDFAIEREKQSVDFYEKLKDRESFPASRQSLTELAEEERKHQTLLEGFKKGKRTIVEYKYEWIPDIKRSDYLVDTKYEPGMDFVEILRLAMKREENALRLYNALATKTDDAECIKLFKMLAQEEAKHKQLFETFYDDHMAKLGD